MKLRIAFPFILILSSMLLAACGLGVNAAKPSPTADPQKAMLAYAQCMRAHGVDMPDPNGGAMTFKNVDPATMDAAQNACKSKLKGQNPKGLSPKEQAQMRDAAVKYAQCMREHGIDMPDPQFSGNGAVQRLGGNVDPSSAEFQAADKACNKYLPNRPGMTTHVGSGGGPGSGSGGTFSVQGPN